MSRQRSARFCSQPGCPRQRRGSFLPVDDDPSMYTKLCDGQVRPNTWTDHGLDGGLGLGQVLPVAVDTGPPGLMTVRNLGQRVPVTVPFATGVRRRPGPAPPGPLLRRGRRTTEDVGDEPDLFGRCHRLPAIAMPWDCRAFESAHGSTLCSSDMLTDGDSGCRSPRLTRLSRCPPRGHLQARERCRRPSRSAASATRERALPLQPAVKRGKDGEDGEDHPNNANADPFGNGSGRTGARHGAAYGRQRESGGRHQPEEQDGEGAAPTDDPLPDERSMYSSTPSAGQEAAAGRGVRPIGAGDRRDIRPLGRGRPRSGRRRGLLLRPRRALCYPADPDRRSSIARSLDRSIARSHVATLCGCC